MLKKIIFVCSLLVLISCGSKKEEMDIESINWESRAAKNLPSDSSAVSGSTYLSIYSEIYSQNEHNVRGLTVTVSIRNTSESAKCYLKRAECFNSDGTTANNYFKKPVYLNPLETLEIIIDEDDPIGGSGGNFIFDWITEPGQPAPIFEAVMISTASQLGISFVTQGIKIK